MIDFEQIFKEYRKKFSKEASQQYEGVSVILSDWERSLGKILPQSYRYFMRYFGHGDIKLLVGSDYTFNHNKDLKLKIYADELLAECGMPKLDDDYYVFAFHQGYEFLYFKFAEGDNPAVYRFSEVDKLNKKIYNSFLDFFYDIVSNIKEG